MTKHKPKPSAISSIWSLFNDRSPVVKLLLLLAGVIGAASAVDAFYEKSGLPYPASRGFVELKIGPLKLAFDNTGKAVRDLQIEAAEGKLSATTEALAKWQLEELKAKDSDTKELIHRQQRELHDTEQRLKQQLRTLRTQRDAM